MKKTQRKQTKKVNNTPNNNEQSLSDFGLEPPKIYRNSSGKIISDYKDIDLKKRLPKNKNQNLTRAEKRQRDNKKRKKRNKIRKVIIWLVVSIILIATATVLSLTVFFRIDTINVSGNEIYSKNEILTHCTIDKGENLFLSDTQTAKKMLEQSLPYIYNAEIKRKLPYTIQIKITEATPAYSIKNKDKTYILLDDNFKVLENNAKKAKGISITNAQVLSSEPGNVIKFKDEKISQCLNELAVVVKDNKLDSITGIYSKGINENYVVYDNRITFKLGSCTDAENKIYQGLAACEKLNASTPNAKGVMTITGGKQIYFTEK